MIAPRIRWVIAEPWRATDRNMRAFLTEGLKRALVFWWKRFLWLHFTTYAYTRYPGIFKKRVPKSRYRERSGGGQGDIRQTVKRPLYWTGLTRQMALSSMKMSSVSLGTVEKPTAYAAAAMSSAQARGEYFSFGSSHVVVKGVLTIPSYVGYL